MSTKPSLATDRGVIIKERPIKNCQYSDYRFSTNLSRIEWGKACSRRLSIAFEESQHTVDGFIARDPHHAIGHILLLAELDAAIDEPLLVIGRADGAPDPAGRHVVDADSLLVAGAAGGPHEAAQSVLGRSVFPIALTDAVSYQQ